MDPRNPTQQNKQNTFVSEKETERMSAVNTPVSLKVSEPIVKPPEEVPHVRKSADSASETSFNFTSLTQNRRMFILAALFTALIAIIALTVFVVAAPVGTGAVPFAAKPTFTPLPTLTPTPIYGSGPQLGETLSQFSAAYGAPVQQFSDNASFNATIQGIPVYVFAFLTRGSTGSTLISATHIEPAAGSSWTALQAESIMNHFAPEGATLSGEITSGGNTYHILLSSTLARLFPASVFIQIDRKPAKAGEIAWFCAPDLSFCYIGPVTPNQ